MGTPAISRRTFLGRRLDSSLAGITPRIFTALAYQRLVASRRGCAERDSARAADRARWCVALNARRAGPVVEARGGHPAPSPARLIRSPAGGAQDEGSHSAGCPLPRLAATRPISVYENSPHVAAAWTWRGVRDGSLERQKLLRGSAGGAGAAEAGIEDVSEGVAEHVEAEDGERDGGAGEDGHPGRALHEGAAGAREHGAPRRAWRRDTEAEEGE